MTTTLSPAGPRRARRLGIQAHTDFVTTLVSELKSSVTRLQAAAGRLSDHPSEADDLDRPTSDIVRLVDLLDAIDGPGGHRRLAGVSLPALIVEVTEDLEVPVTINGEWGEDLFLADAASVRTGLELLFLAFAAGGQPVEILISSDWVIVIDGALDLEDERTGWHVRCGRRVLEGEDIAVRLIRTGTGGRVLLRVGDH